MDDIAYMAALQAELRRSTPNELVSLFQEAIKRRASQQPDVTAAFQVSARWGVEPRHTSQENEQAGYFISDDPVLLADCSALRCNGVEQLAEQLSAARLTARQTQPL